MQSSMRSVDSFVYMFGVFLSHPFDEMEKFACWLHMPLLSHVHDLMVIPNLC